MFGPHVLRHLRAFFRAFSPKLRLMWTTLNDSLSQLGESPFWHPAERSLYWLDIPGCARAATSPGPRSSDGMCRPSPVAWRPRAPAVW
jgi:hypothetical protein